MANNRKDRGSDSNNGSSRARASSAGITKQFLPPPSITPMRSGVRPARTSDNSTRPAATAATTSESVTLSAATMTVTHSTVSNEHNGYNGHRGSSAEGRLHPELNESSNGDDETHVYWSTSPPSSFQSIQRDRQAAAQQRNYQQQRYMIQEQQQQQQQQQQNQWSMQYDDGSSSNAMPSRLTSDSRSELGKRTRQTPKTAAQEARQVMRFLRGSSVSSVTTSSASVAAEALSTTPRSTSSTSIATELVDKNANSDAVDGRSPSGYSPPTASKSAPISAQIVRRAHSSTAADMLDIDSGTGSGGLGNRPRFNVRRAKEALLATLLEPVGSTMRNRHGIEDDTDSFELESGTLTTSQTSSSSSQVHRQTAADFSIDISRSGSVNGNRGSQSGSEYDDYNSSDQQDSNRIPKRMRINEGTPVLMRRSVSVNSLQTVFKLEHNEQFRIQAPTSSLDVAAPDSPTAVITRGTQQQLSLGISNTNSYSIANANANTNTNSNPNANANANTTIHANIKADNNNITNAARTDEFADITGDDDVWESLAAELDSSNEDIITSSAEQQPGLSLKLSLETAASENTIATSPAALQAVAIDDEFADLDDLDGMFDDDDDFMMELDDEMEALLDGAAVPTSNNQQPNPAPPKMQRASIDTQETQIIPDIAQFQPVPAIHLGVSIKPEPQPQLQSKLQPQPQPQSAQLRFIRLVVLEINAGGSYQTAAGIPSAQVELRLIDENDLKERYIYLRDDWINLPVQIGDYVHVSHTSFDSDSVAVIDHDHGLLTLHPDLLISCTHLSDGFHCRRRAVLQSRVRDTAVSGPIVAATYGSLVHNLFQSCLWAADFSDNYIQSKLDELVRESGDALYAIQHDEYDAKQKIMEHVPALQQWAERYVGSTPAPQGTVVEHMRRTRPDPSLRHNDSKPLQRQQQQQQQQQHLARSGYRANQLPQRTLAVTKLLDIEDTVWSPRYGLTGNIDASIQATIHEPATGDNQPAVSTAAVMPVELKTGMLTNSVQHYAQTLLYTLLMSDRYDIPVNAGLLMYTRSDDMVAVNATHNELRALLIGRNELAAHMVHKPMALPEMRRDARVCGKCPYLNVCAVHHYLMESGNKSSSGMEEHFDRATEHLRGGGKDYHGNPMASDKHAAFYEKWMAMINAEEKDVLSGRAEVWSLSSANRQKLGRCFANMVIESINHTSDEDQLNEPGAVALETVKGKLRDSTISRWRIKFRRRRIAVPASAETESGDDAAVAPPVTIKAEDGELKYKLVPDGPSLINSQINIGEPVVISSERGHFGFAVGFVIEISAEYVVVSTSRMIYGIPQRMNGFDDEFEQKFRGITDLRNVNLDSSGMGDVYCEDSMPPDSEGLLKWENVIAPPANDKSQDDSCVPTFRIDLDSLPGMARMARSHIAHLFTRDTGDADVSERSSVAVGGNSSERLRRLVVDLDAPTFDRFDPAQLEQLPDRIRQLLSGLNFQQRSSVMSVLSARDYALILGMPGTGKTLTMASLIRVLVALGKSVLLTAYTHSAVDEVLLKLSNICKGEDSNLLSLGVLRLGNPDRIHKDIVAEGVTLASMPENTREHLAERTIFYETRHVVATTCLGISHAIFARRRFDVCIVDEASQVNLPVSLGPLRCASTFVLVGDHYQLQPLMSRNTKENLAAMFSSTDYGLGSNLMASNEFASSSLRRGISLSSAGSSGSSDDFGNDANMNGDSEGIRAAVVAAAAAVARTAQSSANLLRVEGEESDTSRLSLFSRLAEAHPEAVTVLEFQYRMNRAINDLANHMVYGSRLECATAVVASQKVKLRNMAHGMALVHRHKETPVAAAAVGSKYDSTKHSGTGVVYEKSSCPGAGGFSRIDASSSKLESSARVDTELAKRCWLATVIDPELQAVFVSTNRIPARDQSSHGTLVQNDIEVTLIRQIASALVTSGMEAKDICVISPYRSQIRNIATALRATAAEPAPSTAAAQRPQQPQQPQQQKQQQQQKPLVPLTDVQVLTVDRSQGKDAKCVIISFVRSNANGEVGILLKDWRRINVAVTRAKEKLILIGDEATLRCGAPLLSEMAAFLEQKQLIVSLPPKAHLMHHI